MRNNRFTRIIKHHWRTNYSRKLDIQCTNQWLKICFFNEILTMFYMQITHQRHPMHIQYICTLYFHPSRKITFQFLFPVSNNIWALQKLVFSNTTSITIQKVINVVTKPCIKSVYCHFPVLNGQPCFFFLQRKIGFTGFNYTLPEKNDGSQPPPPFFYGDLKNVFSRCQ